MNHRIVVSALSLGLLATLSSFESLIKLPYFSWLGTIEPLYHFATTLGIVSVGPWALAALAFVAYTRHIHTEARLLSERRLYDAVLSNLETGLVVFNQKNAVIYSNLDELSTEDDTKTGSLGARQRPRSLPSPLDQLPPDIDHAVMTHTVADKVLELRKMQVAPVEPGPAMTVYSWRDITDWGRSQRLSHEFVASVSHELRTPLTSIRGYLELALSDDDISNEHRRYLIIAQSNVDRLTLIIEDLMDLSRIDAGMVGLNMQNCNVTTIVRQVAESFGAEIQAKELTIKLDMPEHAVLTVTDRDRLHQILANLIGNACKYNKDGGKVAVRVGTTANEVVVSVADTGIGIPEDEQSHVFERFFRSSSSRLLAVKGTGLGLTITRSLVESLGGKIWFRSVAGEGSVFGFSLPLTESSPSAEPATSST